MQPQPGFGGRAGPPASNLLPQESLARRRSKRQRLIPMAAEVSGPNIEGPAVASPPSRPQDYTPELEGPAISLPVRRTLRNDCPEDRWRSTCAKELPRMPCRAGPEGPGPGFATWVSDAGPANHYSLEIRDSNEIRTSFSMKRGKVRPIHHRQMTAPIAATCKRPAARVEQIRLHALG